MKLVQVCLPNRFRELSKPMATASYGTIIQHLIKIILVFPCELFCQSKKESHLLAQYGLPKYDRNLIMSVAGSQTVLRREGPNCTSSSWKNPHNEDHARTRHRTLSKAAIISKDTIFLPKDPIFSQLQSLRTLRNIFVDSEATT